MFNRTIYVMFEVGCTFLTVRIYAFLFDRCDKMSFSIYVDMIRISVYDQKCKLVK